MARRSGVWFHRRRQMFFTTIDSRQVNLGVPGPDTPENRAAAETALRGLLDGPPEPVRVPAAPPVSAAVAAFLAARQRDVARGDLGRETFAGYRTAAHALSAAFGTRPASSLTAADLEDWAYRDGWGRSTRRVYLGVAVRVLKAAGHALSVRRPPAESRGADCVLTDGQFAAVLADLRGRAGAHDLPALLELLRATGARPKELATLTAEMVDWPNALARLTRHKTRRKTGKARVVHFNTDAMAVLRRQLARYPSGLLFRNAIGRAYTPTRIADRLAVVSRRVGFRVLAYGLRHAFATRALEQGIPDTVVAGLLGHTGTAVLHHHYQHVGENARLLKEAAERVSRGRAG